MMKKMFILLGILGTLSFQLMGQTLNVEELKRPGALASIEFINYVGPHKVLSTREEIIEIGTSLGREAKVSERAQVGQKYRVLRFFDDQAELLSADLLILDGTAGVDHIVNLNRIVAGYLVEVFQYTFTEAELLADFVTRYNAVYRGDMAHFGSNFISQVVSQLSKENAGISRIYSDWPGKTRLVIPLRSSLSKGPRGQINTDEITKDPVIEELKKEESSLEPRKDISDLKDKEIKEEEKVIQKLEEDLDKKETEIDKKIEELKEEKKPDDKDSGSKEADKPLLTEEAKKEEIKKLEEEKATIQEDKKVLEEKKEELEKRDEKLQEEKVKLAEEEKKLIEEKADTPTVAEPVSVDPVLFLKVLGSTGLGQLVVLDAKSKKVIQQSALNSIQGRRFEIFNQGLLVISGRSVGDAAIRVLLLDPKTLEILKQGEVDTSFDSALLVSGNQFYTVVKEESGWVVGLHDSDLKVKTLSTVKVQSNSFMTIKEGQLFVQGEDGRIKALDTETLELKGDMNG